MVLLRGVAMEGSRSVSKSLLAVRREFAGSRLEQQVLVRAYELAVPVGHRRVGSLEQTSAKEQIIRLPRCEGRPQLIAKGA
jgi:hypothetical protein